MEKLVSNIHSKPMETFQLETQTPEQIREEQRLAKQREKLAEMQASRLAGKPLDLTADLFGEGPTPLFNQVRSKR